MTSNDSTTFKLGNKLGVGRHNGSRNQQTLALQQAGMERAQSLLAMHIKAADEGNEDARKFLLDKLFPAIKPGRFIEIEIPKINSINDVLPAQQSVMEFVATGIITLEEADKIYSHMNHHLDTIKLVDFAQKMDDINVRMEKMEKASSL